MASAILTSIGRFLFQFGLACFLLATIISLMLTAYGVQVHPVISTMAKVLPFIGLGSAVMAIFSTVFIPQLSQLAGLARYLSLFLPAVSGIVAIVSGLIALLPLPPAVVNALAIAVPTIATACIAYYIAVKIGALPPE